MDDVAVVVKAPLNRIPTDRPRLSWRWLFGGWGQDLALALRSLRRNGLTTLLVILTLALGVGASATVFGVINATLLRPLPYDDPDRLVLLVSSYPESGVEKALVSPVTFRDWLEHNTVFEGLAAVSNTSPLTLTGIDGALSLDAEYVSAGYFDLLGVEPLLGRTFELEEEVVPGAGTVAVISHHLWQELFAGSRGALGQTLTLNGQAFEVVGVMPPLFRGLQWDPIDVWLSTGMAGVMFGGDRFLTDRETGWHLTLGRLREGVGLAAARESMSALAGNLEEEYALTSSGLVPTIFPLLEHYYRDKERSRLRFLLIAAGFVLLICCGNVMALVLATLLGRSQEIALRTVLGAGRLRLARLFTTYTAILTAAGVVFGLSLAGWLAGRLVGLSDLPPATFPGDYLDLRVFVLAGAVAVVMAAVLGLVPAVLAGRFASPALLRSGSQGRESGRRRYLRGALVVVEIGLALTLTVGAGLMIRSLHHLMFEEAGFDVDRLLTMEIVRSADEAREEPGRVVAFAERLQREAAALPGVEAATVVGPQAPPWSSGASWILAAGRTGAEESGEDLLVARRAVLPGYFEALGVDLVRGRDFGLLDDVDHPQVAIVSQAVADLLWPDQEPLGARFQLGAADGDPWWTVIGIAPTLTQYRSSTVPPGRDLYLAFTQRPQARFYALLRTPTPSATAPALRDLVARLHPDLPVNTVETMEERYTLWSADTRFNGALVVGFAVIAVVLAAVGVYGLLAADVRQRRQELGIRVALGAPPRALRGVVLVRSLKLLAAGLALGGIGCFFLERLMSSLIHGVQAAEPWSLSLVLAVITLAVLTAAYLPARRASRVDPMRVLREE